MLDEMHDEYDIDLPLADLAVSDPYKHAVAKVESATYYGLAPALGYSCHHLAFRQENIDWQVWIQDGPQPLIRKLVITHKAEEGSPEFTALITHWDFAERISESDFVFEPPSGAVRIPLHREQHVAEQPNHAPTTALSSPKER